jgi:hypothetical protein
MEKIGMTRDAQGDFGHPQFSKEHWPSRHVLYPMEKGESSDDKKTLNH